MSKIDVRTNVVNPIQWMQNHQIFVQVDQREFLAPTSVVLRKHCAKGPLNLSPIQ